MGPDTFLKGLYVTVGGLHKYLNYTEFSKDSEVGALTKNTGSKLDPGYLGRT